ncbi:hypothetical protein SAMN05216189_10714 [Pseudomonas delhiensis]|uniref:Uncharacterized protein n=1 Tax=Pseudomonas delhiensis TaxID=366289 RepID=A0A239N4A0_9PSED|nr:hypothetical protein [Pseudomonas delhiensis]SDL10933.1 hypothetical protein SAMN05216189_10714 [Pseudomonas delhiensis]SNT49274.1 hypothetical protein SAMN06295949_1364 [Pseudomonas delhiensis]
MNGSKYGASRAGSHAGRGFRYQDAVGVWLATQCWSGALPYGEVIPEGQDDYELRGATRSALVQVKSRRDHLGPFSISEAANFVRELWHRNEGASYPLADDLILVIEQPITEGPPIDHRLADHLGLAKAMASDPRWNSLAPRTLVWITPAPFEVALRSISRITSCAPLAAQVHYAELLSSIGGLADANGVVKDTRYAGLAVSDMEACVRRIAPILDLSGMETALRDGLCEALDFLTPTDDPSFYQGINTRPGHLAAGLVAERPETRSIVLDALETSGATLIVGQSGSGKSALMWEAARAIRHTVRWFEIKRGDAADAHLFMRLAQALRASPAAPLGFILDDVGRGGSSLWDGLSKEVGSGSGILLLGSIREEDVFMLTARASAKEVRPPVEEAVAERIWRRLLDQGRTSWVGWREPWERSGGLLLEYTHILTRGDRIEAVLREQVDRRLRESRDTELTILRVTSLAGMAGATIDAERLSTVLNIAHGDLGRGLRRLIDEHLVAAKEDGRIGGLHQLRSAMLFDLCHAYPPQAPSLTVAEAVHSVHSDSLEALTAHVLVNHPSATSAFVAALASRLEREQDPVALVTALSGMGQAHIEATLRTWVQEALSDGLEPSQITLAAMFAVANMDTSLMPLPDRLSNAVSVLRTRSAVDPRMNLLSALSRTSLHQMVTTSDIHRLRALIGALVGMELPETLRSSLLAVKPNFDAVNLGDLADLLGAVHLIDPRITSGWVEAPMRNRLLGRVPHELPWAGPVTIEAAPEGRLLRSIIYYVAPSAQARLNDEVAPLCATLLGLDPSATVAAVDAIAADGLRSELPDASKRIPRKNTPFTALPAWNKRWVAAAARLVGNDSYTDYLHRSYDMLERLLPALERIVDTTLRGKPPQAKILDRLGNIHDTSRQLTPPRDASPNGGAPAEHSTPLQNLLFHCSADLIRRFIKLPDNYGAFVLWVGDLLKNVRDARVEPWELLGRSPEKLLDRLENLITSLRLLAIETGTQGLNLMQWRSIARNALPDDALRSVRMAVERQLQASSESYLQSIEAELKRQSIELELHTRPDWETPLPWPNRDFLAIADISYPGDWPAWIEAHAAQVQTIIGEGRQVWFVPRIGHLALSCLTIKGRCSLFASPYSGDDWLETLQQPRLNDALTREAQRGIELITELDGMRCFRLGEENRSTAEQAVRQDHERQLAVALKAFEAQAEGTSVQMQLRKFSEDVAAGQIALAKGLAALLRNRLTSDWIALLTLQNALLEQDLTAAECRQKGI